jgi:O-succinylbenzoate synthase
MFTVKQSHYELQPRTRLGSRASAAPRQGALLKFQFDEEAIGYADCFPWPELGDESLNVHLEKLKQGQLTGLTQRALAFAKEDAIARQQKRSLWTDLKIPQSHFLMGDLLSASPSTIESKIQEGFSRFKIKMGSNWKSEAQRLQELSPIFRNLNAFIRLDLNSSLSPQELEECLQQLEPVLDRIDFIEDPCPYQADIWSNFQRRWQVRFALDRWPNISNWKPQVGSFQVLILKPAAQDPDLLVHLAREWKCSIVVTSYLAHPLEQLNASWVAGRLLADDSGMIEQCGLLSHSAYEENRFSKQLNSNGPCFIPPEDSTGFGFDSDLTNLTWGPL